MRLVAIDFETATAQRGSACALGFAVIEDGQVTRSGSHLIRPRPLKFDPMNVAIHGITEDKVKSAPEFPEVLEQVRPELEGALVMAHNAAFDMSVMRATLDKYSLPYPQLTYLCSAKLAGVAWPELATTRLDVVADHLGLKFAHHQAEADAVTCARIAMLAAEHLGLHHLADVEACTPVRLGRLWATGYEPCSAPRLNDSKKRTVEIGVRDDSPLNGRTVAITGTLSLMTRDDAARLIARAGGVFQSGVRRDTDYLVVGPAEIASLKDGLTTGKLDKALAQRNKGYGPEIIGEAEFYAMAHDPEGAAVGAV